MKNSVRLAAIGGVATVATGLFAGTSLAATQQNAARQRGAVFVQTDAVTGNAIVVYDRAADGTLHAAGTLPCGHWIAEEMPDILTEQLLAFLR